MFTYILESKESDTSSIHEILQLVIEKVREQFAEISKNDIDFFTTENKNNYILKSPIDIEEKLKEINNNEHFVLKSLKGLSKFTSLKEKEKIDLKETEDTLILPPVSKDEELFDSDSDKIEEDTEQNTNLNTNVSKYAENINFEIIKKKYTSISRDEVYDNLLKKKRCTRPFMTKYERTKLLCIRAQQLCNGAQFLVSVPLNKQDDVEFIVEKELKEGKIPLIIRRYLYDGSYEDWKSEELHYLH